MTRRYYSNTATQVTLSGTISAGAGTCSINETFAGWPGSYPFDAVLEYGTANAEVVTVTAISGKTATITRGQDGTTALSHSAGATLDHAVIAKDLDEANAHINASASVHGLLGSVVGDSDTQTLTNKTINAGTLTGTFQASLPIFTNTGTTTFAVKNTGTTTGNAAIKVVPGGSSGNTYSLRCRDSGDANDLFTVDDLGRINAASLAVTGAVSLPAWMDFTPTLTAATTNPTGWTVTGKWQSFGSLVFYEITLQAGASFTAGSGDYIVSLPIPAAQSQITPLGSAVVTSNNWTFIPTLVGTSTFKLATTDASSNYLGSSGPYGHAWNSTNIVRISGMYRVS